MQHMQSAVDGRLQRPSQAAAEALRPALRGDLDNILAKALRTLPAERYASVAALAADLRAHLDGTASALQDLVAAIKAWRLWPLNGLPHVRSAKELAFGRIALMGDAAHPMLPYLAQGAGMAIEDAAALAEVLSTPVLGDVAALERYAQTRWRRNARVQARAQRNGEIFHATGVQRWGRDAAMQLLGQRLLDVPWLYGSG
jgi:salicylate hydroxylase